MKRNARAASSRLVYAGCFKRFMAYCAAHGHEKLPVPTELVENYLVELARELVPSTVNVHLSAIAHAHRGAAIPFDTSIFAETMAGIRNKALHKPRKAKAATIETLDAVEFGDDVRGLRDRAVVLLGFWLARRRSELSGLDLGHLGDGTGWLEFKSAGIEVTLAKSKANQDGRHESYALPKETAPEVEAALRVWIDTAGIEPGTALFRQIGKGKGARIGGRLSGHAINEIVKARVGSTGHGLRRGFITEAANLGLTTLEIMQQSGHRSHDMVRQYVDDAEKFRNNAAAKLAARRRRKV